MTTAPSASGSEPTPPPVLAADAMDASDGLASLAGCYLLRLDPPNGPAVPDVHYDGTLRVSAEKSVVAYSGDLYVHRVPATGDPKEPKPKDGIPVFARSAYRFYIRGITLDSGAAMPSLTLGFELHAYDHASGTWQDKGSRRATMKAVLDQAGQSVPGIYSGDVKSASGEVVGVLQATRVSKSLRKAVIEIDRVPKMERPFDNGLGADWKSVFDPVGWELTIERGDSNIAEPNGASWTDAELHDTMLKSRRRDDLDAEWRYHVLCVKLIERTDRGLMYDASSIDSNDVPREGIGIGTGWIPTEAVWGPLVGKRFGTATSSYFRTALHEIGHAMGLRHNKVDFGVMNTTDLLARDASQPAFPENALWAFATDDRHRLRHLPDIWVRPGGIPWGFSYESSPISDESDVDAPNGLRLKVTPLLEVVPLGAPVRVEYELANGSRRSIQAPASINVRDGAVSGRVVDPAGVVRRFRAMVRCVDAAGTDELEPSGRLSHAITLLRGSDGALFPMPGVHRIFIDVTWRTARGLASVSGESSVIVTGPEDHDHAVAAHRMLTVPNAMLTLVIGGDHLKDGIDTIHRALDCQQLNEHVAWVEAKRVAVPFFERPARLQQAVGLLDEQTVMSQAEVARAAEIVKDARPARVAVGAVMGAGLTDAADEGFDGDVPDADAQALDRLVGILQSKVQRKAVAGKIRAEVSAL